MSQHEELGGAPERDPSLRLLDPENEDIISPHGSSAGRLLRGPSYSYLQRRPSGYLARIVSVSSGVFFRKPVSEKAFLMRL